MTTAHEPSHTNAPPTSAADDRGPAVANAATASNVASNAGHLANAPAAASRPASITVQRLIRQLDALWPWRHSSDETTTGLIVGDREQELHAAMLCLHPTEAVIGEAAARGHGALLCWQTPFLSPITDITTRTPAGRMVLQLARTNVSLIVGGDAWSAAPGGLHDALFDIMDVRKRRPLHPSTLPSRARVTVTLDTATLDPVLRALEKAGVTADDMTVTPVHRRITPDAAPDTLRLEVSVGDEQRRNVVTAAVAAHPDGERAVEHHVLGNTDKAAGEGRVGELAERQPAKFVMGEVKRLLEVSHVSVLGALGQRVRRVAIALRGTEPSVRQAINYGATCLIAGDVDYDAARAAAEAGLVVLDPGFIPLAWWSLRQLVPRMIAAFEGVSVTTTSFDPALFS
ncbi:MAG: Nif3-like dinuclear metal center hexameric protein [Planctomycetota bacterium]